MKIRESLVLRQVGNEYMVVNPFSETMDMTNVFTLNESAAWLWQQLEGKDFTIDDMTALLCEAYDVDEKTAHQDADELLALWVKNGLALE